jgi:hypothetical protein
MALFHWFEVLIGALMGALTGGLLRFLLNDSKAF